ncbi:dual-action HEIGH metallo-peptidase [Neolewinella xylanilytica]|uniref:Dual-action HEIGH metallo-peptidase n=1 Tax=Neolewinella xylanilytica TaxID=1514080 RepID=A0A2S6I5Z0_9BACT|nr:M57 family metalloprotease [Neolewinella xylanilytica]PPK86582.1 dual-action HEIGH metallo-peptidase [Neolewinella xylanilytica]
MRLPLLIFPALFAFALSSCSEESVLSPEPAKPASGFLVDQNEDGHVAMPDLGLEAPVIAHVEGHSAHYESAERIEVTRPDGTVETRYLVDNDIELTKDQLRELQAMDAALEKQYRTNNLATDNRISVIGYTGSGNALTSKMQTALQWAIDNYNALNTNKQFTLTFGSGTNADIVVYRNTTNNGAGGVAGFPSGGRPYKWVQIYNGMESYDTNTNEHVITHEIGHCMGLRHTDWFSRESCRQSGESAGSDGAVLIPGTPSGFDPNSVMLSCFSSGEDGEFGYYDRVALEYLY